MCVVLLSSQSSQVGWSRCCKPSMFAGDAAVLDGKNMGCPCVVVVVMDGSLCTHNGTDLFVNRVLAKKLF